MDTGFKKEIKMKEILEKKELKQVEIKTIISIKYLCDRCKKEIIKKDCYDRSENVIQFKTGDVFPEGGTVYIDEAYLCKDCGKIIKKILIENGIIFTDNRREYG
jgi:DNA-directed RNA polymerase subunit RPC12/RpoP